LIVSHKHKFIYIKNKRTAGTSIDIALSKICGADDILTIINVEDEDLRKKIGNIKAQNYNIPFYQYNLKDWYRYIVKGKRFVFYSHMSALKLKRYVSSEVWDTYYKFSFERNPISKCISHYHWRGKQVNYSSFKDYLNSEDVFMLKGNHYYKDKEGNFLVDKVYKMEEMDNAFINIAEKLGIDKNLLTPPHFETKKTSDKHTVNKENLTAENNQKIREIFETEFKEFYAND